MIDRRIENCNVSFAFRCPERWQALDETGDPGIRHCRVCEKPVYLSRSKAEAEANARAGRCVAVARWGGDESAVDPDAARLLPEHIARRHRVVALRREGGVITLAMADTSNEHAVADVQFFTQFEIERVEATQEQVERAIEIAYASDGPELELGVIEYEDDPEPIGQNDVVGRFLAIVLRQAARLGASEVTIGLERSIVIRSLVDGAWSEQTTAPASLWPALVARLREASGASESHEGVLSTTRARRPVGFAVRLDGGGARLSRLHDEGPGSEP